jgi:hypothetical protein
LFAIVKNNKEKKAKDCYQENRTATVQTASFEFADEEREFGTGLSQ